jgi:hypothetical protein
VLNRLGHCVERHKFDQLPVRIGRSYRNDLIVSDPHVSPEHCQIHENENGWQVEDRHSQNGTHIKHHPNNKPSDYLHSGDDIVIGRCRLRVYSPDHQVTPTHPMPTISQFEKLIGQPLVMTSIIILTLIVMMMNQQLVTVRTVGIEKLVASALPAIIGASLWAGIWAFVGRVIKHKASFATQLSISMLFALSLMLINNFGQYLTFITSSSLTAKATEILLTGMALLTLLYINIDNATMATPRARLVTSHAVTWSLILFGLFMEFASKPDFRHTPSFSSTLKPPFAKLAPSQTLEEFLEDSDSVFRVHRE